MIKKQFGIIAGEKDQAEGKKKEMQGFVQTIEEAIQERKHLLDAKKEEVESSVKQRSTNSKNLKKFEDAEHKMFRFLFFFNKKKKRWRADFSGQPTKEAGEPSAWVPDRVDKAEQADNDAGEGAREVRDRGLAGPREVLPNDRGGEDQEQHDQRALEEEPGSGSQAEAPAEPLRGCQVGPQPLLQEPAGELGGN